VPPLATAFVQIQAETGTFASEAEKQLTSAGTRAGMAFGQELSTSAAQSLRKSGAKLAEAAGSRGQEGGRRFGQNFSKGLNVGGLVKVISGAFLTLQGIGVFKGFIDEARESQRAGRQTAAVLKSTGGAAHVTADQIGNLATAISNKVGVDDEAIQSAENLLLTFKGVRNEAGAGNAIFDRTSTAIVDMTAAMNNGEVTTTGMKASTIQLGKALNDPIKGLSALSRVGVTFTDQQKQQITSMVAAGNTLGAQKIILKEVESEFGGAAKAAADPVQKMQVAWGNFQETVGLMLMPLLTAVANWFAGPGLATITAWGTRVGSVANAVGGVVSGPLGTFFHFMQSGSGWAAALRGALIGMVGAIVAIRLATTAWAAIQAVLNAEMLANPVGLIVIAIGALVGAIVVAWQRSATFRNVVMATWTALRVGFLAAWNAVRPGLEALGQVFTQVWSTLQSKFRIFWTYAGPILGTVFRVYLQALMIEFQIFWRIVSTAWTILSTGFRAVWGFLGPILGTVFKIYIRALVLEFKILWTVVSTAWTILSTGFRAVWGFLEPILGTVFKLYIRALILEFRTFWTVVQVVWRGLQTSVQVAWSILRPIFSAIGSVLRSNLILTFQLLSNVVKLVWIAIQLYIKAAWLVIKGVWTAMRLYVTQFLIPIFNTLWHGVIVPVWNGIRSTISTAWSYIRGIWNTLRAYLSGVLTPAFRAFQSGMSVIWAGVRNTINTASNAVKTILNGLKTAVAAVRTAFQVAVSAIGVVWGKLQGIAKTPVNFIIGLYDHGILPLVNGIAGLAGIKTRLSYINPFADGGVYPGYSPGRDIGLAAVSGGEAIMRPEWTRAIGPRLIYAWNKMAKSGGVTAIRKYLKGGGSPLLSEGAQFSDGGIVGTPFAGHYDLGGIVSGFINGAKNFLLGNVGKAVSGVLSKILGGAVPGSGLFHDVVAGIPQWALGGLKGWLTSKAQGAGGPGMQRALAFAKAQSGKPYIWGAVGPAGYDCSGFMSAITNVIHGSNPYSRVFSTASFGGTTAPGGFVRDLRSGFMVGVTKNAGGGIGHMAGTLLGVNVESSGSVGPHYGSGARGYNDGLFSMHYGLKADTGVLTLRPGWNPPVYNGTGRDETLRTAAQSGPMVGELHLHGLPDIPSDRQVASSLERVATMHGAHWRR
jgi:phage-related protein